MKFYSKKIELMTLKLGKAPQNRAPFSFWFSKDD